MKRNIRIGPIVVCVGYLALLILVVGNAGAQNTGSRSEVSGPSRVDVLATVPLSTTFTYQGQLKQGNNLPTTSCGMAFRLYDAASAGNQVGNPITTTVPVTNGLFTVSLDFGASAFVGDAHWLQVAVQCPAGSGSFITLGPRQALTASPYALYSRSTGALQGWPISSTMPSPGEVLKWNGSQWAPAVDDTGGGGTNAWKLTGNAGTDPSINFLGTTDNVSLTLAVNGIAALRLVPNATSPNIIGGYGGNRVSDSVVGATIGGGGAALLPTPGPNRVTDDYGTVSGGAGNQAGNFTGTTDDAAYTTAGGGQSNIASDLWATIGGGGFNNATNRAATIGGGWGNAAGGGFAPTISGGYRNTASGSGATIPGGESNTAAGDYSFAAGLNAKALDQGAFVWADSAGVPITSTAANQFIVRASGGVTMYTDSDAALGATLPPGSGAWSTVSDRNAKANFATLNSREVLARLASIPIQTWNYKTQDTSIRHIGPTAQEFYAAFGMGEDDTHISTVDADGVALAAIQGMYQVVQEKDAKITALEARLAKLEQSAQPVPFDHFIVFSTMVLSGFVLLLAQQYTRRGGMR